MLELCPISFSFILYLPSSYCHCMLASSGSTLHTIDLLDTIAVVPAIPLVRLRERREREESIIIIVVGCDAVLHRRSIPFGRVSSAGSAVVPEGHRTSWTRSRQELLQSHWSSEYYVSWTSTALCAMRRAILTSKKVRMVYSISMAERRCSASIIRSRRVLLLWDIVGLVGVFVRNYGLLMR
jgi:hypothetical protein